MKIRTQAIHSIEVSLAFVATPTPHYELAVFSKYTQTDSYWISDTLTAHACFEQLCDKLAILGNVQYYDAIGLAELYLMIMFFDQIQPYWSCWREYIFDVCEAFACLETDYNVSGCIRERPHTHSKRESVGVQLHRIGFSGFLVGGTRALSPNAKAIYIHYAKKWGLPL